MNIFHLALFSFSLLPLTLSFVPNTRGRAPLKKQDIALQASSPSDGSTVERDTVPETVKSSSQTRSPASVQRLASLEDFLTFVDDAPQDSLSVVKFFSKNCPLCRRIELKYKKMAHFYQKASIQFSEIERSAHAELFPTLGVNTFPFLQIYRNSACVAAHGTENEKTFEPIVHDTIQRELLMTQQEWDDFVTTFAAPIQVSTEKLERVRSLLQN